MQTPQQISARANATGRVSLSGTRREISSIKAEAPTSLDFGYTCRRFFARGEKAYGEPTHTKTVMGLVNRFTLGERARQRRRRPKENQVTGQGARDNDAEDSAPIRSNVATPTYQSQHSPNDATNLSGNVPNLPDLEAF
jgi:hypothetical protein